MMVLSTFAFLHKGLAMTIEAYVENGQIILPNPLELPNGTKVTVSVEGEPEVDCDTKEESRGTINERLKDVIGKAEGLPVDFAENHDHYLHGTLR